MVEMWECEWREMKKTNRELQRFIATEVKRKLDQVKTMSAERILSEARNERLFGCVEVDIRVPDHLKDKFSEMCPIFKNTNISRDDIGEFMKSYAEENNIMPQPRRSLIGSMKGEKILLARPSSNGILSMAWRSQKSTKSLNILLNPASNRLVTQYLTRDEQETQTLTKPSSQIQ